MTVSIDIPDEAGVDEHFLKEALAASLYYTGKLSQKQARNVLGMTRRAFEEMLPRYGYSILVDSPSNLDIERGA
ncbi:MAG: UPF0175 family protein [Rhodothermales bacterium]